MGGVWRESILSDRLQGSNLLRRQVNQSGGRVSSTVHTSSGVREWKRKTPLLRSVGSACLCLRKASIPQRPTHIIRKKSSTASLKSLSANNVEMLLWLDQYVILLFY